ncbi:methylated-DNA--protein-cysteine methyltransferase-related protein [Enhygromyxa salina]|uniref:Methylated-DNA--protein-cysteine methyltransferase-related protein n=1 Tax=Enhygromyxa salina TaxID=215803 RepID=A0A0C1ZHN5_9BACT|nr:MGMT family protein [Enhygromyxa salina]KIG17114.1 methylated-DNA--protein-cysteine methyltransferase-related protein [Enhygromyxa salina]
MQRTPPSDANWRAICAAVAAIPAGKVASYGQVALLAGLPGRARLVGRVLSHLPPGSEVPWQRVVNARGEISLGDRAAARQRRLLEAEGVRFDVRGRIDLRQFGVIGR